jgi:CrcB protein
LRAKAFGSVWLGSLLRWLTGRVIGEHYHGDFPVGTFLINV